MNAERQTAALWTLMGTGRLSGYDLDWEASADTLDKFAQTQRVARGLCFCGV